MYKFYNIVHFGNSGIYRQMRCAMSENFKSSLFMQVFIILGVIFILNELRKKKLDILFFIIAVLLSLDLYDFSVETLYRFSIITNVIVIKYLLLFENIVAILAGIISTVATIIIKNQPELPPSKYRLIYAALAIISFIIAALIGGILYHH